MQLIKYTCLISVFLFLLSPLRGQEEIDYAAELALLESELDSLGIFSLLDSVLSSDYTPPTELIIRTGYSTNMINAGRNYGIDQYGLSSGVSLYHQKGYYADVSSYWNSDYTPMYTVTMFSGGFLGSFKKNMTYSVSYEHWLYNTDQEVFDDALRNSLGGYFSYDMGPLFIGLDYSYLFNANRSTNRLIGSIASQIQFRDIWIFDRVSFLPNVNLVYGNDEVTIYYDGDLIDAFRSKELLNSKFDQRAILDLLSQVDRAILNQIQQNQGLSDREKRTRRLQVLLSNPDVLDYIYNELDEITNSYGIMSYSASLPVSFTIKNWQLMLAYTLAVPVPLPGEDFDLDPVSYFSGTLSYRIPFSWK